MYEREIPFIIDIPEPEFFVPAEFIFSGIYRIRNGSQGFHSCFRAGYLKRFATTICLLKIVLGQGVKILYSRYNFLISFIMKNRGKTKLLFYGGHFYRLWSFYLTYLSCGATVQCHIMRLICFPGASCKIRHIYRF